jgi:hypothetical protein
VSDRQAIAIPEGMTCKVDAPRIRVRKGQKFRGKIDMFRCCKRRIEPTWYDEDWPIVQVVNDPPKNGPLALLHSNPDEFFRQVIKQVFAEMPT